MKKTSKQAPPVTRRKRDDDRMTTAEISLLREKKRLHRHMVTGVIGLALMVGGTAMYFSPHAQANDDYIVEELDDSQIVDNLELTDLDFEFGDMMVAESSQAPTPHPDFLAISEEEAKQRADAVTEDDLPADGAYDPSTLLVDLASDTTQDDVSAVVVDAGCSVNTMLAENDGQFGASFSVDVPEDKDILELYRDLLADRRVSSCGFNLYLQQESVVQDDKFILDDLSEWSDGTESYDTDLTLEQAQDRSVFDDPNETYIDLNSDTPMLQAEAVSNWVLEPTADDPDGTSEARWEYKRLHYADVWNIAKTQGRVTVAVIDSGVSETHKDLANLIHNPIHVDKDGNVTQGQQDDPNDNGHGTHVAGIISAQANNQFGISGLSYNARIMPIQLESLDSNGKITSASAKSAFFYIAQGNKLTNAQKNNVRVVNISLGCPVDQKAGAQWIADTAQAMARLDASGTLVVSAAGNQTSDATVPYLSVPSYKSDSSQEAPTNLLSVINLEQNADDPAGTPHRKSSSNYNRGSNHDYEISAPGTDIYSAAKESDKGFCMRSGTSQAAPIVSATAALMFAANPDLTPTEVKQIIFDTATDLGPAGFDAETGYGEINVVEAVKKARSTATIDDVMDIGRENDIMLAPVTLTINGQSYPAFDYKQIGYNLEYNGLRATPPETAFKFSNIPAGLTLYRRVSDAEQSDVMENAVNGAKYREVSQVITFLFAKKNASLTDANALYGIYAFYIRYKIAQSDDMIGAESGEGSTEGDINEIVTKSDTTKRTVPEALQDMKFATAEGNVMAFQYSAPETPIYKRVHKERYVDNLPQVVDLPEGYGFVATPLGDRQHHESLQIGSSTISDVTTKEYQISVSNYLESFDYKVILYYHPGVLDDGNSNSTYGVWEVDYNSLDLGSNYVRVTDNLFLTNTPEIVNLPTGYTFEIVPSTDDVVEGEIDISDDDSIIAYHKDYRVVVMDADRNVDKSCSLIMYFESTSSANNDPTSIDASGAQSADRGATSTFTTSDDGSSNEWAPTSENPDDSWLVLKQIKCQINNRIYSAFQYDKTDYIIYFKVGSTLPPQPLITSLPQGWTVTQTSIAEIAKSPQFPYGGTAYSIVVGSSSTKRSRQYDFKYAFSDSGTMGSGNGGSASTASGKGNSGKTGASSATTTGQAQTVADSPNTVTTTYVEDSSQQNSTVEIGGLVGQETEAVNAANKGGSSTQATDTSSQWKPTSTTSTASDSGKSIASTSPASSFVSGGTLTQTGDAVVIVCGGLISAGSLLGILMARRRMKLVA